MPTTRLFFDVGSLSIAKDLLGRATEVGRRNRSFVLRFPQTDASFKFSEQEAWAIHAFGTATGRVAEDHTALYSHVRFGPMSSDTWITVQALAIDTVLPEAAPLGLRTPVSSAGVEAQAYKRAVRDLIPDAIALVEDFVGWVRVLTGQYWLPSGDDQIRPLRPVLLLDDSGLPIYEWTEHVTGGAIVLLDADSALIVEQLDAVIHHIRSDNPVPQPELLIEDARYHALWGSNRDRARATLFAAMACEAKIKAGLLDGAAENLRRFVSDILTHREFPSMAVAKLFDSPARAVFGVSLRDEDDQLWKAVDRLFTARNKFVHARTIPTASEAIAHVQAADSAVKWIDKMSVRVH